MTEDEIRSMEVEVLQKVFGVKKIHYHDYNDGKKYPHYIPSGKPWRTHQIDSRPVPSFLSSADADYAVLDRVRQHWMGEDDVRGFKFGAQLEYMWSDRRKAVGRNRLFAYMEYQPGDYSRAALLALADQS